MSCDSWYWRPVDMLSVRREDDLSNAAKQALREYDIMIGTKGE